MIAQSERRLETSLQRCETAEMLGPLRVGKPIKPHAPCPALIAIAQNRLRETGWLDGIVKRIAQSGVYFCALETRSGVEITHVSQTSRVPSGSRLD